MVEYFQHERENMIQIGDKVQVGSRIGAELASGTVVAILPPWGNMARMYQVRFDVPQKIAVSELVDKFDECWVDEGIVYGPFIDQNIGWD